MKQGSRGVGGESFFLKKFSSPTKNINFIKNFARKKVNRLFFAYIIYVDFRKNEKREEF